MRATTILVAGLTLLQVASFATGADAASKKNNHKYGTKHHSSGAFPPAPGNERVSYRERSNRPVLEGRVEDIDRQENGVQLIGRVEQTSRGDGGSDMLGAVVGTLLGGNVQANYGNSYQDVAVPSPYDQCPVNAYGQPTRRCVAMVNQALAERQASMQGQRFQCRNAYGQMVLTYNYRPGCMAIDPASDYATGDY